MCWGICKQGRRLRKETKGKLKNSEFISPNTFILGTIQVSESAMQKPTPTLLGHPTVKLGKLLSSFRTGDWKKVKRCYLAFIYHNILFYQFLTYMEFSGEFRKELGILGNFSLVRPYAMEDPKSLYGLK